MDVTISRVQTGLHCPTTLPTFSRDVQPIFAVSCAKTGCHDGNSMPLNFAVYSNIKPLLADSSIYYYVIKDRAMPQDSVLPDATIALLQCWFLNGFAE